MNPANADTERDRRALQMRAAGKSIPQIAKALKVSESRVKQLLARARKAVTAVAAPPAVSGPVAIPIVSPITGLGTHNGIDLSVVATLRRHGHETAADIARLMGLPPRVLLAQENAEVVKEAMAVGKAFDKHDALSVFHGAVDGGKGQLTGLAIFRMKQHGWTDRQALDLVVEVNSGVRDRVGAAAEALIAKWAAEGRS